MWVEEVDNVKDNCDKMYYLGLLEIEISIKTNEAASSNKVQI